MTDEQLRAAITDIVTDAWDRSRQIDGAVDEIMDAVALAAQHPSQSAGEPVGTLNVSRFRGHLENHSFDYTGTLPDGTYPLYTSPPPADAARASEEEPSEKQRKLLELADRIDYERLCLRPGMTHRDMTPEQRDRMNAGVELRRYAQIWKAGRWVVIPPVGPVRFSADTLDRAVEMAKRDEARRGATPAEPDTVKVEADRRDAERLDWLEQQVVNVRKPLRYGSHNMFWASPERDDYPVQPSDLRKQIDAALTAEKKNGIRPAGGEQE